MQAQSGYFGSAAGNIVDSGCWVSVHRVGARRVVRRSGWLPRGLAMDPITLRELAPRLILGVCIAAAAAAGAFALNLLDREAAHESGGGSVASAEG